MALSPSDTTPFSDQKSELQYIIDRAKVYGLEPAAVLAVAAHEGITLPSQPGDNNSSFGPWQMHVGGKLPSNIAAQGADYAQKWANSPAGINYALAGISKVAKGLTGFNAISTIVQRFEQPRKDLVPGEIQNSYKSYLSGGVPGEPGKPAASVGSGFWNDIKNSAVSGLTGNPIGAAVGGAEAAGSLVGLSPKDIPGVSQYDALTGFFGKLVDPSFLLRAGEVVAGAVLILLGVYLLAKQIGLAPSPPSGPVRAAAAAVA